MIATITSIYHGLDSVMLLNQERKSETDFSYDEWQKFLRANGHLTFPFKIVKHRNGSITTQ